MLKNILLLSLFLMSSLNAKVISLNDGETAQLDYVNFPKIYQLEEMHLKVPHSFTNFKVRLYHAGIDHYSSDPKITETSHENVYLLKNVFFIYEGEWELQIQDEFGNVVGVELFQINKFEQDFTVTTDAIMNNTTYKGEEYYNGKPTFNSCYVIVDRVQKNEKGKHCYDVSWRYASNRTDVPKTQLIVSSRITNYHRAEYPEIKTCAMSIDGRTSGDDIYEDDYSELVNDIFNGRLDIKRTQYHHFLSLNVSDKTLKRARIHGLKWFKEWDVDCVNLQKVE